MTTVSSPDDFAATDPVEVAMTRRRILHAAGALGAGALLSGFAVDTALAATRKTTKKAAAKAAACVQIVSSTGGPFPGNGTNGVNVLTEKGIVRRDIRSSFGSMTGTAAGVPLTINLVLRRASSDCAAFPNAAVYIWHCDAIGQYSLYSIETENYLRGVQVADSKGRFRFLRHSRVPIRVAGRTCTSRCTPTSLQRRPVATPSGRRNSRCPRRRASWFTPSPVTTGVPAASAQPRSPAMVCSVTGGRPRCRRSPVTPRRASSPTLS